MIAINVLVISVNYPRLFEAFVAIVTLILLYFVLKKFRRLLDKLTDKKGKGRK